jgi:hypothetical protein
VHLGQLGARGDRDDDLVRAAAAELLGDLVAEGLGALGVVRADVHVHERPALLLAGDLGGEAVDVVVVAVDRHQVLGVDGRVHLLGLLEVARDEHHGLDPARAPAAATAFARLPVLGQAKTLRPSSRAALRAQATTRSLKELRRVGRSRP